MRHREPLEVSELSSDMTTDTFGVVIGSMNCTETEVMRTLNSLVNAAPGKYTFALGTVPGVCDLARTMHGL